MDDLAGREFWDTYHRRRRGRGIRSLSVLTADLRRLLRRHVRPGMKVLEIGFAPGDLLAWVATRLRAEVAGIDYSESGVAAARQLFERADIAADLHCEDLLATTQPAAAFDVVYSAGVIEHFSDPAKVVRKHVELARPGGLALITLPNYGGVYGRIQRWFDPANLAAHNLDIMSRSRLLELVPREMSGEAKAYRTGRLGAWLISFRARLPRPLAMLASAAMHAIGRVQCCPIRGLESMWVLIVTRNA